MHTRVRLAIITANLGNFDKSVDADYQTYKFHRFTDEDYPPRLNSMTPRLQARIVKMFMWEFLPSFDYYLWVDSSCVLNDVAGVEWFLEQLGDHDIAVFKHPHRSTVAEEADYLKHRLDIGCSYITPRYENEDIDGQLRVVDPTAELFASTAFIYRDSPQVRAAMKEWWYHTSRYHSIDQLSLPYAIKDLRVKVMPENYLKVPQALTYVRNQK